jgi:hypothetical protein
VDCLERGIAGPAVLGHIGQQLGGAREWAIVSIAADGRSGTSTTTSTGTSLLAARLISAAPRPPSSAAGWMLRARSRSSVMASV